MLTEALLAAVAEAVFGYLLQESDLASQTRAALGLDPQRRAFQAALARCYADFARRHPQWAAALFDQTFLAGPETAPLLAELLTRRGQPEPARLARLYAQHLGQVAPASWERWQEAVQVAGDLLRSLEAELAREPALHALYDSRALERLVAEAVAIRQALERLLQGTHTPEDVPILRQSLSEGRLTLITGERAVALGSSADGAVIITGDGNIVLRLDARQRADLERLLAARTYNLPALPDHYIPREEFLDPLRRALLADGAAALGIVGVKGMGGIGKSVLAAALAHDPQVRAAFPDGVVWLPIGQQPHLPARQEELYLFLTRERETFRDEIQGRGFLASALADKRCLVILDDVWDARHAEAFPLRAPAPTRWLLTTRDARVLTTLQARPFELDVLSPDQALRLLADWAGQEVAALPSEARDVARECGYLPLPWRWWAPSSARTPNHGERPCAACKRPTWRNSAGSSPATSTPPCCPPWM
jgi:hypothetical protein